MNPFRLTRSGRLDIPTLRLRAVPVSVATVARKVCATQIFCTAIRPSLEQHDEIDDKQPDAGTDSGERCGTVNFEGPPAGVPADE